jgi:hypothetical protein
MTSEVSNVNLYFNGDYLVIFWYYYLSTLMIQLGYISEYTFISLVIILNFTSNYLKLL